MTNYINSSELIEITHISVKPEDNVDSAITRAQVELNERLGKTVDYTGTESNYKTVQRALAFLSAYFIRLERKEIDYSKIELSEFERVMKRLSNDVDPSKVKYWKPTVTLAIQDTDTT